MNMENVNIKKGVIVAIVSTALLAVFLPEQIAGRLMIWAFVMMGLGISGLFFSMGATMAISELSDYQEKRLKRKLKQENRMSEFI